MKLLVIVLNKAEKIEEVLAALLELDISDATLIESEGMFNVLATEVPIFAGLRQLVTDTRGASKTIFALTARRNILQELHHLLQDEGLDLRDTEIGFMFTVPVDEVL